MESTSVTSKGQVTIPKRLRQKLGLRQGSKVAFVLVGDRVEMRVVSTPTAASAVTSGFGLLTSKRKPVPAEFDVAAFCSACPAFGPIAKGNSTRMRPMG